MKLTIELPPSVNEYWRTGAVPVKGKPGKYRAMIYKTAAAREYVERVKWNARKERAQMIDDGDVIVEGTVFFENRRRDLDGAFKVLFDVLQGIAYKNDRQVAHINIGRDFDKDNPRVELRISRLDGSTGLVLVG